MLIDVEMRFSFGQVTARRARQAYGDGKASLEKIEKIFCTRSLVRLKEIRFILTGTMENKKYLNFSDV
jgi:hypothetical protein